jgi:hypothetical protein
MPRSLKHRLAKLEQKATNSEQGDGYGFPDVMTVDEWCAIAPAQQKELVLQTLKLANREGDTSWQH